MLIGRAADGSNLNVSAAVDTNKAMPAGKGKGCPWFPKSYLGHISLIR